MARRSAKRVRSARSRASDRYWIQRAVKRPGRVRAYMKRKYGKRAFTKTGEIKVSYLKKAAKETKSRRLARKAVFWYYFSLSLLKLNYAHS
jgi:hypothetical protein